MKIADLINHWDQVEQQQEAARTYAIPLPVRDAARIEALAAMYPHQGALAILAELVHAALDELECAMPYIPGPRVIAEDDYGDPVFEDIGPTPRFFVLSQEIAQRLRAESPKDN